MPHYVSEMSKYAIRVKFAWLIAIALLACILRAEPITVRMMAGAGFGIPPKEASDPRSVARRAIFEEFQRRNPDIRVENAGGLELVGANADSLFLMSMAGSNAPDVFYVNFRQYYNFIENGFCRKLDDLVAESPQVLARTSPIIRDVLTSYDGSYYSIPFYHVALGWYYRKDFFEEAGLESRSKPKNWEEFLLFGRELCENFPDKYALLLSAPPGYLASNFFYQAGGEIVRRDQQTRQWKSAIDSPANAKALQFFRKLTSETWTGRDGKTYGPIAKLSTDYRGDIRRGKALMWFDYTNDVSICSGVDLPVSQIGLCEMPAGPAGRSNEINAGMWAINASVTDPVKVAAAWKFIRFFAEQEAAKINTEKLVDLGLGSMVNPVYLERFGYPELVSSVDPQIVAVSKNLFASGHPEPYGKNCQQIYTVIDSLLETARLYPDRDAGALLKNADKEINEKLIGYKPVEVMQQQRAWALGILTCLILGTGALLIQAGRKWFSNRSSGHFESKRMRIGFYFLCLLPAAATILLWSYYPLSKGLVIAFQDYKLTQPPQWVGLDNFIQVFTNPIFWRAILNSFTFVILSIALGFLLPIFLAIALDEIPRAKVFFRTIFYLPAMTSPMVIALMWRQFYDKTPDGLLNSVLAPFISLVNKGLVPLGITPILPVHDWLGDPSLAMFAVVLPGIWAAAGPGSILYLAALKNIPNERYEAADLDGANWRQKIRLITIPGIRQLMLINLLGVFIGGFKSMENVFVLTFGGPLHATHTMGLEVWQNAFMFLKFGFATAEAWVMGAILIGFTVVQIRFLLQSKFQAAR